MAVDEAVCGGGLLDPDTWQCQLEELLALQAVYDDDFSILAAPGAQPPDDVDHASRAGAAGGSQPPTSYGSDSGRWLDPEALLMAGPPPCLFVGGSGCQGASSASRSGGSGAGRSGAGAGVAGASPACRSFVAEALVHVDVPGRGLELVLELPPHALQPQPEPQPRVPPGDALAASRAEAGVPLLAAEAAGIGITQQPAAPSSSMATAGAGRGGSKHAEHPRAKGHAGAMQEPLAVLEGEWTTVNKVGGGQGRGRSRGRGRGGCHAGVEAGCRGRGAGGRGRASYVAGGVVVAVPIQADFTHGAAAAGDAVASGSGGDAGVAPGGNGHRGLGGGGRGGSGRGRGQGGRPRQQVSASGDAAVAATSELAPQPEPGRGSGPAPSSVRDPPSAKGGGQGGRQGRRQTGDDGKRQPGATAVSDGTGTGTRAETQSAPADSILPPSAPGAAASAPAGGSSACAPANGTHAAGFAVPACRASAADDGSPCVPTPPSPSAAAASAAAAPSSVPPTSATTSSSPALVPFGASVHFLSPLRVTLTLPPTYPAADPPSVTLQALWLSAEQAAALVSELMAQWEAGGQGAPVAFIWLDWLRAAALEHLGMRRQLVLRVAAAADIMAAAGAGEGAASAVAAAGPEGLAVSLLRYSARREQEKFNESNVSCAICLSEHLGARCARLPECGDAFCCGCITTHLRTQLREGAVDNMRCPAPACRRQLPPYALRELLSQEEYQRWETLTLQRTLDKMEDLVYCPRCREPCLEDKDHCTLCPKCFYSFCSLCEDAWHPGSTCLDVEGRLALLEERRRGGGGEGLTATERARRELNKRNELMSLALLQKTTKQCPMCNMGVEKTDGCNKMTCTYCGNYFCWKCSKAIRGYDHFQQSPEGHCVLFEQTEIDRWNARWQAAPPAAVHAEQRGMLVDYLVRHDRQVRIVNCVVCGQRNLKEAGNNDIRCWSCNSHFCYLCRTWLRTKPGAHFGAGRCRQHTDD